MKHLLTHAISKLRLCSWVGFGFILLLVIALIVSKPINAHAQDYSCALGSQSNADTNVCEQRSPPPNGHRIVHPSGATSSPSSNTVTDWWNSLNDGTKIIIVIFGLIAVGWILGKLGVFGNTTAGNAPTNRPNHENKKIKGQVIVIGGLSTDAMGSQAMAMREMYNNGAKQILSQARGLLSNGWSEEQVARWIVQMRNELKVQIRTQGPALFKKIAEMRNARKYGNTVGPSYEALKSLGKTDAQIIEDVARTSKGFNASGPGFRAAGRALEATGFIFMAMEDSPASLEPLPPSEAEQVEIERARLKYGIPAGANIDRHGHLKPGFYMQVDMIDPHIGDELGAESEELLWYLGVDITYTYEGVKWTVPGR